MSKILKTENFFLLSPRIWLPLASLGIVMLFPAFINYWMGANNYSPGQELAAEVANKAINSSLLGLFFIIWTLQYIVHHIQSGFYRSMLAFGACRHTLFLYGQFQIMVYLIIFLVINYLSNAFIGLFFGVMPWQLIIQTNYNNLLSLSLFLYATGNMAVLLAFVKPGHLLVLPLLLYWILEGWIVRFAEKHWHITILKHLPLNSFKIVIGEVIMTWLQLFIAGVYLTVIVVLLYHYIQKKAML